MTTLYSPVIGGSLAVDQLKNTYQSNTGVRAWKAFKDFWFILYIGFNALLFRKELTFATKALMDDK